MAPLPGMSEMTALSPLAEIEANVQLRAKKLQMDVGRDTGRDLLRTLVREEVSRWSDDYKRGLRSFDLSDPDLSDPDLVAERALRNVAGYGPLEPLLADDDVWEIMINAPDTSMAECRYRHRARSRAPKLF